MFDRSFQLFRSKRGITLQWCLGKRMIRAWFWRTPSNDRIGPRLRGSWRDGVKFTLARNHRLVDINLFVRRSGVAILSGLVDVDTATLDV